MAICYHCEKTPMAGRSHTHHRGVAGGRWKKRAQKTNRVFKINIQKVSIIEEGKEKQIGLCAKCIKRIRKDIKDGKKPFIKLANTLKKSEKKV